FYGALLTAIFTFVVVARLKKIDFWFLGDAAAPALLLAYSIGRIGCLLIGDDYGTPSNLPWAVSFPHGSPPTFERVHPTQIYDTLLMFIAFLFLWRIRKRDLPTGWISYFTLIILGVERFLIEFIRSTTPSFIPFLSEAQIISIGFIVVGLYKFIQLKIRTKDF
ncbi:MAG: prolipoprotein diacylglyceryl transferase, partial [Thermodesulfobacteriota bacterium]